MAKRNHGQEAFTRFNLVTGEDTYASQTAQNPTTSRRLQSFIPSLAGDLAREKPNVKFENLNGWSGQVIWLFEYDKDNGDGTVTRHYYCATRLFTDHASINLFHSLGDPSLSNFGNWTLVALPQPHGGTNSQLNDAPQAVVTNNLMHLSDGTNSWLFDGTSYVLEGFPIPRTPPISGATAYGFVNVTSAVRVNGRVTIHYTYSGSQVPLQTGWNVVVSGCDTSFNGTFSIINASGNSGLGQFDYLQPEVINETSGALGIVTPVPLDIATNRFYWYSWLDQTAGRGLLESDASPISVGTGPLPGPTNYKIAVKPNAGFVTLNFGFTTIYAEQTAFTQDNVGGALYINGVIASPGYIVSVVSDGSSAELSAPAPFSITGANFLIAPRRATDWVLYASESDNSQVGFRLAVLPVYQAFYWDMSAFVDNPNNLFDTIERPLRNDPPVPSKIQEIHKNRIFRRRETAPRFFNFTAFEEVAGNLNGSPQESTPGTDPNTISDIVNEDPVNDDSIGIRSLKSHGDALYIATEKNVTPLYGQSIDSFTLSNITAFKVGVAGRFAMSSTPHGLAFVSYDKKVYLYPSQSPAVGNSTQYLIELSRPKRTAFENMKSSELDRVHLVFYNYGRRNWLVLAFRDTQNVYHTWVYDFETQGWFELQRGVASLAVWEISNGNRILVGGGTDGMMYVLDDLTNLLIPAGYTVGNFPQSIFRPALIDWGKPDHYHLFKYMEFEVSNVLLGQESINVDYWLDPVDVDNPGPSSGTLIFSQVRGSNFFRAFTKGGSLCYRLLLEIKLNSDNKDGVLRGVSIVADAASSLIF